MITFTARGCVKVPLIQPWCCPTDSPPLLRNAIVVYSTFVHYFDSLWLVVEEVLSSFYLFTSYTVNITS